MGGDVFILSICRNLYLFQSTPPYGGRHAYSPFVTIYKSVSIHAPVWGATRHRCCHPDDHPVSIHAPVWGATSCLFIYYGIVTFQSTPPYGGRRFLLAHPRAFRRFNPRPRMGGDVFGTFYVRPWSGFNPRPRMGGDGKAGRV